MADIFIEYLQQIEALKKQKKYDEAWRIANKAKFELHKSRDMDWYMMYYQMADILTREKKYDEALEKMALVVHFLKGPGGISHEKMIKRLLKKLNMESKYDEYIKLSIKTQPSEMHNQLILMQNNLSKESKTKE